MTFIYETNPASIEKESFRIIRQESNLDKFSQEEQQVVMRIIHSVGLPSITEHIRFSTNACGIGRKALANRAAILCDVEMVKQGITKRLVDKEPLCFLNNSQVQGIAKETGETRTMAALSLWAELIKDSVVIIGNAPTALFRLLEMIQHGGNKPALIIGMPVGFVGAQESKQTLWDLHKSLGVECITLLGRQGGSSVSSASCNALLRCNHGEWY